MIEDTIKRILPCISNAMVIGDKKKFLSCLLTLKVRVGQFDTLFEMLFFISKLICPKVEVDNDTMEPKPELTSAAKDWCQENGIKGKTIDEILTGADYAR